VVPTVRHLHSKPKSINPELYPDNLQNGAQYKKIAKDITGHFERASRICRYILNPEGCFSWREVCTIHDQEASTVVDIFVTDSFLTSASQGNRSATSNTSLTFSYIQLT
jgi:hypothetical protein